MIPRRTLRQIANAVEAQGGDLDDVRDLVECYERLHAGLAHANAAYNAGDTQTAENIWTELERDYAKPLTDIVRDRLAERRQADQEGAPA